MSGTILFQTKNTMPRIDKIWAFLSIDPVDGNEGVCAATIGGTLMPLIAADPARLKALEPIARQLAKASGNTIKLVEFSTRTEVREIK